MSCGAVVQNRAGQEYPTMAGSVSSRKSLFELEVWSDRELASGANAERDQLNGSGGGSSTVFRKGNFKKASKPHKWDENRENQDPYWASRLPHTAVQTSSLHHRYPLRDITAFIHSLQGLDLQSKGEIPHRLGVVTDARVCRNEIIKKANLRRRNLLQMR
ncbi:hypothetical protein L7F22_063200 [Adiantum nelumboides]|nr:hypothetical protein [Adiantum nelumboides]